MTEIEVPDFDYSAFYYPQLLERLIQFKRQNVPELTDESAFEPFIQMLRAQALVGHLNNTLTDLVANESTLPTAKLVETVRNMLRLIAYEMRPATPSQVEIVAELSKVFTSAFDVITAGAQVATAREGDAPIISFEMLEALTIDPTDAFSYCYSEEDGVFTDRTAAINSSDPGNDFAPWATAAMKDAIYFGHKNAMWDEIRLDVATAAANITGIWEFYDGNFRKTAPTAVTVDGSNLDVDLTALLGTANRQGTKVRVQYNQSTAYQDVFSTWDGVNNVCQVTGYLGQTIPSTDPTKYTVGSDWTELVVTGPTNFTADGDIEYALPQTTTKNWKLGAVNTYTAYWIRYRIISVSTPTSPSVRQARMDTGKQYVMRQATQGKTAGDDPLGSSTGLPSQRFETSRDNFVLNSETITVDAVAWTRVTNFLDSGALDKHYVVELGKNDRATIVFGDGVNGRIPGIGVGNIAAAYRFGANEDGNVGSNRITVDKSGLTYVNKVYNPRQATGWKKAQGADKASLERAKIEGPASLRTREVALGPSDIESLALSYVDETGANPFSRALAIEEGFGPKTIELVVVAAGGGLATNDQLSALQEYFNGDKYSVPPKPKRLVANQEVTAVNYTPKVINVIATVDGDVEEESVRNRLIQVINPEATKDDGVTFEWQFGATVPVSRVEHEIFKADEEEITDVTVSGGNTVLQPRELPIIGTVTLTIV